MDLYKIVTKALVLKVMRLIEQRSDYYLGHNNHFYPFVNPIVGIRTSRHYKSDAREVWAYGMDKVQHGVAQLISQELYDQKVRGAIAELGVFRGFNASVLNHFFPDRRLYLFDTFEGFDPRDVKVDEQLGYKTEHYHNFSDTPI